MKINAKNKNLKAKYNFYIYYCLKVNNFFYFNNINIIIIISAESQSKKCQNKTVLSNAC